MAKYTPSIMIWNLELKEIDSKIPFQNIYFLTHKGIERFLEKHKNELIDCSWSYGAERLWFWQKQYIN